MMNLISPSQKYEIHLEKKSASMTADFLIDDLSASLFSSVTSDVREARRQMCVSERSWQNTLGFANSDPSINRTCHTWRNKSYSLRVGILRVFTVGENIKSGHQIFQLFSFKSFINYVKQYIFASKKEGPIISVIAIIR